MGVPSQGYPLNFNINNLPVRYFGGDYDEPVHTLIAAGAQAASATFDNTINHYNQHVFQVEYTGTITAASIGIYRSLDGVTFEATPVQTFTATTTGILTAIGGYFPTLKVVVTTLTGGGTATVLYVGGNQ